MQGRLEKETRRGAEQSPLQMKISLVAEHEVGQDLADGFAARRVADHAPREARGEEALTQARGQQQLAPEILEDALRVTAGGAILAQRQRQEAGGAERI